jgi:hypothetical protein
MKYLPALLLALFVSSAFGQDVKPVAEKTAEFANDNWSQLGPATEGTKGFTLYGKGIRLNPSGQYELWIKIVPANQAVFNRRYDLPKASAFVMQYTIVDCTRKQLLFEKTSLYDSSSAAVAGNTSGLVSTSKKDAVKPGSIGDSVYRNVCVDPSISPKAQ